MKRTEKGLALLAAVVLVAQDVCAGGLLTNTNQNVAFLRNPCRDAAIGIDGVYSNPAGVLFLPEGLHFSVNIQNAHQTRTVTSTFENFKYGVRNGGQTTKKYEGEADAPVVPSLQAAYNRGLWSFQAGFAVTGGGGKCEFSEGLGSFESVVSMLPALVQSSGLTDVSGYDFSSYLKGRQYYFGLQLGAARRFGDNLSAYGGVRILYGSCNYHGYVKDISLVSGGQTVSARQYFSGLYSQAMEGVGKLNEAAEQCAALGLTDKAEEYRAQAEVTQKSAARLGAMAVATTDVTLNCDQNGFGIAPVLGVDFKVWHLNFAVKYDFKTKMRLKNVSANSESASNLSALDKFADGATVEEDAPALLTFGVQWEIVEPLRVSVGYHHFFDKQAKQYADKQKELDGGTNEVMAGVEYDITKRLQVSCGVQKTMYQMTDSYINDMSFNVSSYTIGAGFGICITEKIKVNVAYFQTNYETYSKTTVDYAGLSSLVGTLAGQEAAQGLVQSGALKGSDSFTRTNRVIGIGVDFKF